MNPELNICASVRLRHTLFMAVLCMTFLTMTSCNRGDKTARPNEGPVAFDLESVFQKYRSAQHYRDRAKLVLHYRLNGVTFEEVHPCDFHGARSRQFHFHQFNIEVNATSDTSVARIFDPNSQNLGGQVVCVAESVSDFWNRISRDPIATHFANGNDHIPWNSRLKEEQVSEILNVAFQLFEGQPPRWMSQKTIESAQQVEEGDDTFDDVVFKSSWGPVSCRFDTETQTLLGIRFPTQFLSESIATSPGLTDVSFALIFEETSFDEYPIATPGINANEHPVTEFVQLPEEFPSPAIGKKIDSWNLVRADRSSFDPASLKGIPSVFIYGLPNQYFPEELEKIKTLSNEYSFASFAWIKPLSVTEHSDEYQFTRMKSYIDSQGTLYENIGVDNLAFLMITDGKGIIQFVSEKKKDWLEHVGPVLNRIRNGDDVAREMHTEYSEYFLKYEKGLARVKADESVVNALLTE